MGKKKVRRKLNYHIIKAVVVLKKNGFSFYMIRKLLGFKDKRNLMWVFDRDKNNFLLPEEEKKVGKLNNNKC